MERLAALHAGGELSVREQGRFKQAARTDSALAKLSDEVAAQREWLLALGSEAQDPSRPDGSVDRTRAVLRKRMETVPEARGLGWAWGPVGAAMALLALAVLPWDGFREAGVLTLSDARHAASAPPRALRAPRLAEVARRIPAASVTQASRRALPRAVTAAPRGEESSAAAGGPFTRAFANVDEIVTKDDGEIRLRVKTRNPNVVIYLFQEEFRESGGEE